MQTLETEAVQYNSSLQGVEAGKDLNQNITRKAGKKNPTGHRLIPRPMNRQRSRKQYEKSKLMTLGKKEGHSKILV